jgi:UDP-glucose 4-epimerase
MSVLVTGGAGNIGAMVAAYFARKGDDVVVYDVAPAHEALSIAAPAECRQRIEIVQGDILDLPLLIRTARRRGVERIVHMAAAIASVVRANPALALRVNIEGTNNVFEAALAAGVPRVVWASSLAVFGPRSVGASGIVSNEGPFDPQGAYGASKLLNEKSAAHYATSEGLQLVGLRLPAVYGPVAKGSWIRWLPQAIEALLAGKPARVPLSERLGEFAYGDDIARAADLAFQAKLAGAVALTLAAEARRQNDVNDILAALFPAARFYNLGLADVWDEAPRRYDTQPAKTLLGWEPKIRLEDGIRSIVECLRARG